MNQHVENIGGILCGVGIASPGRFDQNGIIKPGTSTNIGNTPNEFDNINLKEEFEKILHEKYKSKLPIYVRNDGDVMLLGMANSIEKEESKQLLGQIGSLTIGTGVGNAFIKKENNEWKFISDGHASRLLIEIEDSDIELLLKAKEWIEEISGKKEVFAFDDGKVRFEDLCRGPIINALAEVDHGSEIDLHNKKHQNAIKFVAKYMAKTIKAIKDGTSKDISIRNDWPEHGIPSDKLKKSEIKRLSELQYGGWSEEDKKELMNTSEYIIGGGVGCSKILGAEIVKQLKAELYELEIRDIDIIQNKYADVATLSATKLVPLSIYQYPPSNNLNYEKNNVQRSAA